MQTNHNCSSTFPRVYSGFYYCVSRALYRPNCINTWRCLGLSFFTSVEEPSFFFLLRASMLAVLFAKKNQTKIDGRGAHAVTVTCSFSTHNSGRQIQNEQPLNVPRAAAFGSAVFCFFFVFFAPQVVHRRCCVFCVCRRSFFFFSSWKRKETLVLQSDMKIQHIVIRFPVCHT